MRQFPMLNRLLVFQVVAFLFQSGEPVPDFGARHIFVNLAEAISQSKRIKASIAHFFPRFSWRWIWWMRRRK